MTMQALFLQLTLAHDDGQFTISINPLHIAAIVPVDAQPFRTVAESRTAIVLAGGLTYQVKDTQEEVFLQLDALAKEFVSR